MGGEACQVSFSSVGKMINAITSCSISGSKMLHSFRTGAVLQNESKKRARGFKRTKMVKWPEPIYLCDGYVFESVFSRQEKFNRFLRIVAFLKKGF